MAESVIFAAFLRGTAGKEEELAGATSDAKPTPKATTDTSTYGAWPASQTYSNGVAQ
jgi:hypothetical protein